MRISDWSSDVCSSDLHAPAATVGAWFGFDGDRLRRADRLAQLAGDATLLTAGIAPQREFTPEARALWTLFIRVVQGGFAPEHRTQRSEEDTSELQSLMRISYAVFCLKKKKNNKYS